MFAYKPLLTELTSSPVLISFMCDIIYFCFQKYKLFCLLHTLPLFISLKSFIVN